MSDAASRHLMASSEVLASEEERIRGDLQLLEGETYRKYGRFIFAALGSIPWVGGILGGVAALHAESDQGRVNALQQRWLEEHGRKLHELQEALGSIIIRVEQISEEGVRERVESEEFLALARKGFRAWDRSESREKRKLVERLLTHAATTALTSDDVVRMFIDWLDKYHEAHFAVMREVYRNPGATKADIWSAIHGQDVREDSAEADLFKLLMSDLSLGRVVRQVRDTTMDGQYLRRRPTTRRRASPILESAFEDSKPHVLTELGQQFVHYVLTDAVGRLNATDSPEP